MALNLNKDGVSILETEDQWSCQDSSVSAKGY